MTHSNSSNERGALFDARAYWDERLARYPGREGVGHAGLGEGLNGWMYRVRRRVFLRELAPLMRTLPTRTVLDAGSGTGFYVNRWRELGASEIVASDISEVALRRLRDEHPGMAVESFQLGTEPPAGLRSRRFGAISAMEVIFAPARRRDLRAGVRLAVRAARARWRAGLQRELSPRRGTAGGVPAVADD